MKTALIIGTDELAFTAADLINPKEIKLIGFGTTMEDSWNVFDEKGDIKDQIEGLPVMPIDLAAGYNPDLVIVAAMDEAANNALKYMIYRAGFEKDVVFLKEMHDELSIRVSALRRLSYRIRTLGIAGEIADVGCYRGDTSWQLNALFPDRKLYLFDTFTGYDERDIAKEKELKCSETEAGGRYAFQKPEIQIEKLKERLPHPEMAEVRNGWFPETAMTLENEKFALVNLDVQLYLPTYTGIEFFFPRMVQGGIIILNGYGDSHFRGVRKAIEDLEEKYGAFLLIPFGDLEGTSLVVRP